MSNPDLIEPVATDQDAELAKVAQREAGRLNCRKVGRHRRIDFNELHRYQRAQREQSEKALQELADLSQDLGLGY